MDKKIISYDIANGEDNTSFNVTWKNDGFYNTSCIGKQITDENKNVIGTIQSVDDEFVFAQIWNRNIFEQLSCGIIASVSLEDDDEYKKQFKEEYERLRQGINDSNSDYISEENLTYLEALKEIKKKEKDEHRRESMQLNRGKYKKKF